VIEIKIEIEIGLDFDQSKGYQTWDWFSFFWLVKFRFNLWFNTNLNRGLQ